MGLNPNSGQDRSIVRLFHPRRDKWQQHFFWDDSELKALTDIGRVTISVLLINDPGVVAVRRALLEEGVFARQCAFGPALTSWVLLVVTSVRWVRLLLWYGRLSLTRKCDLRKARLGSSQAADCRGHC